MSIDGTRLNCIVLAFYAEPGINQEALGAIKRSLPAEQSLAERLLEPNWILFVYKNSAAQRKTLN